MKMSIRPYGDNELELDGCILKARSSAERLAENILALADRIWPIEKKETDDKSKKK